MNTMNTANSANDTHAIVIGGSMAGLLAARVLSERFDRVTIIERDELPDGAEYRNGVPQARHLHSLLIKGQEIMDDLFPGFTEEMTAEGCPHGTWGWDLAFLVTGGWTPRFDSGLTNNASGRITLEWLVRRRVKAIQNVAFLTNRQVEGLMSDENRSTVKGVRVLSRGDKSEEILYADLVVDASGRGSKAPEWLKALGYKAPDVTIINAHTGYASRWFKRPAAMVLDYGVVGIQPRPAQKFYRGGGYLKVEGDEIVVTLIGANGDYPPTEEESFVEFARSLPTSILYDIIRHAEPISPIYGYRKLENQERHYERLVRRPENFIVTGDAAVALNPIYGQGMTSAALETLELAKLLKHYDVRKLQGFAARFQRQVHKVTRGPWLMATAEDLRYPDVEGSKPGLMTRMIHRYFDLVALAMPHDEVVSNGFFEAMGLVKSPVAAMASPKVLVRVLRHTWFKGLRLPFQENKQSQPEPSVQLQQA